MGSTNSRYCVGYGYRTRACGIRLTEMISGLDKGVLCGSAVRERDFLEISSGKWLVVRLRVDEAIHARSLGPHRAETSV